MLKPPYLLNTSKGRSTRQYLTPRERPMTTHYENRNLYNSNQVYRSRQKQYFTQNSNTSYRDSSRPKSRPSNHFDDLKLRLTSLKQEVNHLMNNDKSNSDSKEATFLANQPIISHRCSSVDQFVHILPQQIQKKPSFQNLNNQRLKDIQAENEHLKQQLSVLKNKYLARKMQSQKQILSLSRRLISTETKLQQKENEMQNYKKQIQIQIQSIRNSLYHKNSIQQSQILEQTIHENLILKKQIKQLSLSLQESTLSISILEQKLKVLMYQNQQLIKSHKLVELSKLSEMRIQSNIFDLSKSKINVEQQKQILATSIQQIQECLKNERQQCKQLKNRIAILNDTIKNQKLSKGQIQKQIDRIRTQLHHKSAEIKLLNEHIIIINKQNDELTKKNHKLEIEIEQLKLNPKQSIINIISSEISVQDTLSSNQQPQNHIQNYLTKIKSLEQQIQKLKSFSNQSTSLFEQKQTEMIPLKKVMQSKDEQILALSTQISFICSELKNQKSEMEIQKLKNIAEKKQLTVSFQINLQSMNSQLDVFKKSNNSLSEKVKILVQDNRKKDEFIQKWILNKTTGIEEREHVQQFLQKYRLEFSKDIGTQIKSD